MGAEEKNIIAKEGIPKELHAHTKKKPHMPSLKPKAMVDEMKVDPDKLAKVRAEHIDLLRLFQNVFKNERGKKMIDHLESYSHKNFPNYDNVNATYSKIGEQTLVAHIKNMLYRAKEVSK